MAKTARSSASRDPSRRTTQFDINSRVCLTFLISSPVKLPPRSKEVASKTIFANRASNTSVVLLRVASRIAFIVLASAKSFLRNSERVLNFSTNALRGSKALTTPFTAVAADTNAVTPVPRPGAPTAATPPISLAADAPMALSLEIFAAIVSAG